MMRVSPLDMCTQRNVFTDFTCTMEEREAKLLGEGKETKKGKLLAR
jgi:hypothetical protein